MGFANHTRALMHRLKDLKTTKKSLYHNKDRYDRNHERDALFDEQQLSPAEQKSLQESARIKVSEHRRIMMIKLSISFIVTIIFTIVLLLYLLPLLKL